MERMIDDACARFAPRSEQGGGVTPRAWLHTPFLAHSAAGLERGDGFWVFYRFYHGGDVLLYGHAAL